MESAVSDGNSGSSPSSFAEAFAADASSASDSSAQSTTPAAAEQLPTATETTPASGDGREPFIPRQRFDEVNTDRNALKQWKEQFAWAEHVDRSAVEQAMQIGQLYTQDRAGYIRQVLSEAIADPQLAPAIRSEAARLLAQGRQQPAPVDLNPIPIEMADGRTLPFFTAEQIQAYAKQQVDQAVGQIRQEMAPALTAAQKLAMAESIEKANTFASTFVGEMSQLPGFDEHKAAVGQEVMRRLSQMPPNDPRREQPEFLESLTMRAYNAVVLPKVSQKAQSQQLDELQRKAAASTAPNPGSAVPTNTKAVSSFHDKSLVW